MDRSILRKRVARYMSKRKTRARTETPMYRRVSNLFRGLKPEMKTTTLHLSNLAPIQPNGIWQPINIVAQGVTREERIGNKILMKGVTISLTHEPYYGAGNVSDSPATIQRVMLVYDRSCHGAQPDNAAFFDGVETVDCPVVYHNLGSRFTILWDFKFWKGDTWQNQSVTGKLDGATQIYHTWKKNFNFTLPANYYDSSVGSIADIEQGGLFLYFFSSQAAHVGDFDGTAQLRYIDT